MKKIVLLITLAVIFLQVHAQNYPLLNPGFNPEITEPPAAAIEQRYITHTLYWERSALFIQPGERLTLTLRCNNWNASQPQPAFFLPEVPRGVILSSVPLSAGDRENGIILKLMLIPLTAEEFILPARVLQFNNIRFEIPSLVIRAAAR